MKAINIAITTLLSLPFFVACGDDYKTISATNAASEQENKEGATDFKLTSIDFNIDKFAETIIETQSNSKNNENNQKKISEAIITFATLNHEAFNFKVNKYVLDELNKHDNKRNEIFAKTISRNPEMIDIISNDLKKSFIKHKTELMEKTIIQLLQIIKNDLNIQIAESEDSPYLNEVEYLNDKSGFRKVLTVFQTDFNEFKQSIIPSELVKPEFINYQSSVKNYHINIDGMNSEKFNEAESRLKQLNIEAKIIAQAFAVKNRIKKSHDETLKEFIEYCVFVSTLNDPYTNEKLTKSLNELNRNTLENVARGFSIYYGILLEKLI